MVENQSAHQVPRSNRILFFIDMDALIILHFWNVHAHPLEQTALDNTKKLLKRTNIKHILFSGVEQKSLFDHTASKQVEFYDDSIYDREADLENWIQQNNINRIYICGLHFNACVMNLTSKIFEVSKRLGKKWEIDFFVKIVEECTAGTVDNKGATMTVDLEHITSMKQKTINDWLVSQKDVR